uniref:Tyrosinase copper-binding domain-containing protein n=2 Tax=Meloidogyne TaxID=189290 RepID=A0A914L0Q2_MELIC
MGSTIIVQTDHFYIIFEKTDEKTDCCVITGKYRENTFAAFAEMKKNGEFDYLASLHKTAFEAGKWHGCTSFFVVHREFLKRAEIILRKINPNISMPYLDVTLDARLPNPADSILFTKEFIGSTDDKGNVIDGPCANFKTLQGDPCITRNVGKEGGRLINEDDVQWILSQPKLDHIMTYTVPGDKCPCEITNKWPEFVHGKAHTYFGGLMLDTALSAGDSCAFFPFHNFLNLLFEKWRYMHQTREQRCTEYPKDNPDCCPPDQYRNSSMYLMEPFLNCDGLKNEYNDNMYEYEDRSVYTCNATTECPSKYMFCDRSKDKPHCASKVKLGGNCTGFPPGTDVCWNGTCVNDVCVYVPTTTPLPTTTPIPTTTPLPTTIPLPTTTPLPTSTIKITVETTTLALPTTVTEESTMLPSTQSLPSAKGPSTSKIDDSETTKEPGVSTIQQANSASSITTPKALEPPNPPRHISKSPSSTSNPLPITVPGEMKKDLPNVAQADTTPLPSTATTFSKITGSNPIERKSTPTTKKVQNTTPCNPIKLSTREQINEYLRRLFGGKPKNKCKN